MRIRRVQAWIGLMTRALAGRVLCANLRPRTDSQEDGEADGNADRHSDDDAGFGGHG